MNKTGAGGGGGGGGAGGYTMEEVAKHTSKTDCWVVVNGEVLDVTSFLSQHPGGELAILTFGGKDASEEFNMIHPPDVIGKYAPDAVIGKLGGAGGGDEASSDEEEAAEATVAVDLNAGLLKKGGRYVNEKHANASRDKRMKEYGKIPGFFGALCYMVLNFMKETVLTIFGQKNLVLTNDRIGLTRSAMFLFVFIVFD